MTAEQQARDMLERIGVDGAQSFTAGDLVELANLLNFSQALTKKNVALGAKVVDGTIASRRISSENKKLRAFAQAIMEAWPEGGIEGDDLQEIAVKHGMLAPDDVVNAIVQKAMKGIDLAKGFVLDGYPRNVEQAANLDRFAKANLAIQLKLLDNAAVKRLQGRRQCTACRAIFHIDAAPSAYLDLCVYCGHAIALREYDHEEALRNRLAIYHFMTEPLAGYYRERGVLLAVNADQPIEDLFEEVAKKIVKLGFMG
jgi:adenylate kinase